MKRFIGILLTAMLVLTSLPFAVSAETTAPEIISQPTTIDPSVEVTHPDEVESYQWYTFEPAADTVITDKNASVYSMADFLEATGQTIPDGVVTTVREYSSYDSENNLWTPAFYTIDTSYSAEILLYFAIELEAGDELILDIGEASFENFVLANLTTWQTLNATQNSDGTIVFTIEENGEHLLASTTTDIDPNEYTISAYGDADAHIAIEGETKSELSEMTYGEKYFCEITYTDGTVISSDVFEAEYAIIQQPTGAAPTVEVTFPDDVEVYEWYKALQMDYGPVTPALVGNFSFADLEAMWGPAPSDIIINQQESAYDYETGIWTPVSYTYSDETSGSACFFAISLEAGESIDVEFVNGVEDADIYLLLVSTAEYDYYDAVENADGTYTITAEAAGEYILCYDSYYELLPEGLGAKVYKENVLIGEAIEGETKKTLYGKEVGESYYCVITYTDGTVLTSDIFTVTEDDMWLLGDVNLDGAVDKKDYALLKRYCFGTAQFNDVQLACADINGDGEVDKKDYGLLKRHCFGTYVIG